MMQTTTLLYENAIIPFSTQLRGNNSKHLAVLGQTTIELNSVVFKVKCVVAKDVIYSFYSG